MGINSMTPQCCDLVISIFIPSQMNGLRTLKWEKDYLFWKKTKIHSIRGFHDRSYILNFSVYKNGFWSYQQSMQNEICFKNAGNLEPPLHCLFLSSVIVGLHKYREELEVSITNLQSPPRLVASSETSSRRFFRTIFVAPAQFTYCVLSRCPSPTDYTHKWTAPQCLHFWRI